jgi:type II secretory pathway pseudopilin PulG
VAAVVTAPRDRALTPVRVIGALLAIALLAFAVPYGAVRMLLNRRVDAADVSTRAIAARLKAALDAGSAAIPAGTEVLAGPGDRPLVAGDDRWNSATSIPLARFLPGTIAPDPWGNAYLVNIAQLKSGGVVWVLSAGPDGIVQTPFLASSGPAADDRAAPIR